jgi:hypothetical protein
MAQVGTRRLFQQAGHRFMVLTTFAFDGDLFSFLIG